ncbi:di-trans,poly-cis-decaprenylcistransferase [Patescibacteria group bacterium]|nr:di-trans,poly-cis-decaprenylcistransferase [Patescibacteria group bacterium]MBU1890806.1 di-trans,poly-cis-decaprenylcistransferase [Patescibacteria group bacterium]
MAKAAVPQHIAIIPDGNRRWAKSKHLPALLGHKRGVDVMEKVCYAAIDRGVKVMTFWAFSTENWRRAKREVNYLLKLFEEVFINRLDKFNSENVKLVVSGRIDEFPDRLQNYIKKAVDKTKNNTRGIVHLCLNYGGRAEIIDMVKKIIKKKISPLKVNRQIIDENLYNPGLPDIDLVVRTSGEQRTSGFLPWQLEYAEYAFVDKHWPDFKEKDIDKLIKDFQSRQRRFGR